MWWGTWPSTLARLQGDVFELHCQHSISSWSRDHRCLEGTEGWNKPKYSLNRLLSLKAHHCKSNNPNILNNYSIFTVMRALNLYQQSTDSRLTIRFRCSVDMKCMVSYIQVSLSDNLCLGLFINDVITWGSAKRSQVMTWWHGGRCAKNWWQNNLSLLNF